MNAIYFYVDGNNQPVGPFTLEDLQAMMNNGTIKSATLVCARGGKSWGALGQIIPPPKKNRTTCGDAHPIT